MKKIRMILAAVLSLSCVLFTACGGGALSQDKNDSGAFSAVADTEKSSADVYDDAMKKIASGNTPEAMELLTEIPSYKDADLLLTGYSYLQYYLGEWEADLTHDYEKGTAAAVYEMNFEVSDTGLWLDSEANDMQRLRFPVHVSYSVWKDGRTEAGDTDFDGYLLFEEGEYDDDTVNCILFGKENGGFWCNFYTGLSSRANGGADRALCSITESDINGDVVENSNNEFYCDRKTKEQNIALVWDKNDAAAGNDKDYHDAYDEYTSPEEEYDTYDYDAAGDEGDAGGYTDSRTYQLILDDYTSQMETAAPGLVREFNSEAAGVMEVESLAEICNDKISDLAEICNTGIQEMAALHNKNGDSYDTYEAWAGKLQDNYSEIASQIQDAYYNAAVELY